MAGESQLGEAFVPIRATLDKLDGDLKQARSKVEGAMKGMEDKSGKAGGALKALGTQVNNLKTQVPALGSAFNLLTNPITLAVAGIGAFGAISKEAIEKFSDLNETVSKSKIVFGEQAKKVLEFGKSAASSLGMSENAALSAAGTYGNLFRSMGMVEDKSADMSIGLVNLAGDLASFNNMDPTEVMDKLRAGLSGETEPLKSLGININETILKVKALEMGLWNGKGALDASAKAQAAYALIMEQTTLAQGDFARTSGGLANQQRILAAEIENLKTALGEKLYPAAIKVLGVLIDITETMTGTYDASKHAEDGISGLDKAFGGLNAGLAGLKEGANILAFIVDLTWSLWHGGLSSKRMEELRQKYFGFAGAIDAIKDNADGIPKTFDIAATSIYGVATAAGILDDELRTAENDLLIEQYATHMENAANQADILATAQETAIRQISRLNEYINGTLGPNEEKFTETQGDLNTKMGEIQGEIDKAIRDGYDPLGEKILELKGKYADLKKQYDENATTHEEDTKRIILGILAQQMAAMGFSDSTAFAKIALKWGLIDEATMNAMMATDKAINWLRNHPGDYAGFEAMMNGVVTDVGGVTTAADNAALALDKITGQHEVGIHVTVTGDAIPNIPSGVWEKGEPYIGAATGFEGIVRKPTFFLAGEDENEYVNITPLSNYKLPTMELRGLDIFGEAGMAMADHKNQMPPAAVPLTINLYAVPGKEKDMRRQARYIAEEFERRSS